MHVPQGILGEDVVLGLAEDEAEGGGIVRVAQEVIHGGTIEIHLPGILGFELAFFEVHHDETAEVQVIEEEVQIKVPPADFQPVLAAHKGKTTPEFEEEFLDVQEQSGLQLPLMEGFLQGEEIKEIGILQQALSNGRMGLRQSGGEVRGGRALALVGAVFDLKSEGVAGPAFLKGLPGIPVAGGEVFELLDEESAGERDVLSNFATARGKISGSLEWATNGAKAGGPNFATGCGKIAAGCCKIGPAATWGAACGTMGYSR